ncbi:MAG TPA: CHASE3 domain-containing protein, partial [Cyclobacteriaceae bacterium]|nr:CHASE3 domain-containing protein [Cyclobacteriaceae bacterium]
MKKASHLNILLFATIIMVLISGFITYLNSNERKDTQRMVLRGYEVIQSAERLFSFMKDMETGHRGYVISGDSSFLGSYEEGREALVLELDSVRNLVIDNPQQTNLFNNKIVPVIRNKSRSMEEGITIYNRHELDSAAAWISNKVGQTHMDTLRILIGSFIQNERALLSERREKLDWNTTIQDTIQFISFALVTVSITFAFFKLKQEKRTIDKLLSELETANRELELKVIERTKELEGANRDKDHFLAIASHDLKVPIAGILRLVELLKLEKQNHSAKDIEYLRYIEDSCNGMQHLISNLLDMNQIDQKKISIVPQKINLHDFLNRLEKNFDSQARKKN